VHAYPLSSQNSLITVNAYFAKDTSDRQKTLIDFFNLNISYIKTMIRNTVGRNLTKDEWIKYFPGTPYQKAFDDLP